MNPLFWPVSHGPWIAFVAMLIVTPIGMIAIAAGFERRWMRPSNEYRAFIVGDPLLAVAVALGTTIVPRNLPYRSGWTQPAVLTLVAGLGLVFGAWQLRTEIYRHVYSRDQAFSPSKLWHQFIVYPLLGTWLWAATALAAPFAPNHVLRSVAALTCVGAWVVLGVYDSRHMRLAHVPYDWPRFRPHPRPWPLDSLSLEYDCERPAHRASR